VSTDAGITLDSLLRLALVPAAVWLASLAARRFGHSVSGYLGGMPLIGGPITFFLALDHGTPFAARSALATLAAVLGQCAHLLAFAHVGRRHRWPLALACGWGAFAAAAIFAASLPLAPAMAFALAMAGLLAAWRWLPRVHGVAPAPTVPPTEMRLRLSAAFLLAIAIVWSAEAFGPVVSGVLLSLPVTGSILPPFTLAVHGPGALARLTRGFVVGLTGFSAFFFTVAATLVPWGIAASFATAIVAALAAVSIATRLARRVTSA
jgi:hypothetical protein